MTKSRAIRWSITAVGGALAVIWIVAAVGSRSSVLQRALMQALNDKLEADVELQSFSATTFPNLRVEGAGLTLRAKNQKDGPPLIEVRHFSVDGGFFGLLSRPRRFRNVTLEGLRINIPPGGLESDRDDSRKTGKSAQQDRDQGPVLIDHLTSTDALLVLLPRNPRKEPKQFAIHTLAMESIGFDRRMPFRATLTNPIPKGTIETTGTFGPWRAGDPGATPLDGRYVFKNVNMDTIDGLGGTLASEGSFEGLLGYIDVKGTTSTPDFSIDVSGQPVPLETTFHAVVDGTDGDTYLRQVDAKLASTALTASGAITGQPGRKGRTVQLDVTIPDGRIEDVLRLAVKSDKPVMIGKLSLKTKLLLPPGHEQVADRLRLDGTFGVGQVKFTDQGVQGKLTSLSRHGQGKDDDEAMQRVVSDLRGRFLMNDGRIRFSSLQFGVPGAQVSLSGTYALRSGALDFDGHLRMQATISEAAGGGVKSFFLKAIDPLFKRKGAGAVIPIHISGTREDPKFGVDVKKALTGG